MSIIFPFFHYCPLNIVIPLVFARDVMTMTQIKNYHFPYFAKAIFYTLYNIYTI